MLIRNLARRWPTQGTLSMWQDVDRVFNDLERGLSRPAGMVAHTRSAAPWPRVLVKQDEEAYHVVAELPGVDSKDLEVLVEAGVLVIKGEREPYFAAADEGEGADEGKEAPRDTFERKIRLAGGIAEDAVQASHRNGVLRVTLPKPKRTVPVNID
jgi:HSP20 family protein